MNTDVPSMPCGMTQLFPFVTRPVRLTTPKVTVEDGGLGERISLSFVWRRKERRTEVEEETRIRQGLK